MALTKATYSLLDSAPVNIRDYGAVGDGVADDTAALNAAVAACYTNQLGSSDRRIAKRLYIPTGKYKITSAIQFAPPEGLFGFTVQGETDGSSWLMLYGSSTTLRCRASSFINFEHLQIWSSGIDDNQTAFEVGQGAENPLRTWKFSNCAFWFFNKCFHATGESMVSEFSFIDCYFIQCYILMQNDNDQAVNWNFYNCHWENEALEDITTKNVNESAIFNLTEGTFSKWVGGSLIFNGRLVYYDLTSSGVVQSTSHKIIFDGVRIELVPNASNSHAALVDKRGAGYVVGSNTLAFSLVDSTIINRGSIPATVVYMNLWNNCDFEISDVEAEGGIIKGLLDSNSGGLNGSIAIINSNGFKYQEDTTSRLNTHDQHNVHFYPTNRTTSQNPILDFRNNQLNIINSTDSKRMWVRGPTGSLPEGGTTINLPALQDHFVILKLFVYRFTVAGQNLTVALKDQADTTTYGTVTINAGVTNQEAYVGAEMGYEIPSGTELMLKFTGTAEIVKGVVGIEYL
jgi:hypothetical protein